MNREKNEEKAAVVELNEPEKEEEEIVLDTEGVSEEEIALAKEHGLVKEEGEKDDADKESREQDSATEEPEDNERARDEGKEETGEGKEGEGTEGDKPLTFEDIEQNENNLKKFNPNEQALYWKWKSDKRKRQRLEKDVEELKNSRVELEQVKNLSAVNKLNRINKLLLGDASNITVEALQEIIKEEDGKDDSAPLTRADLKRIEAEKEQESKKKEESKTVQSERIALAEKIGLSKYPNFKEITDLAGEIVTADKSGMYREVLDTAFRDPNVDESELVERVVAIAKLSDKFKDLKKAPTKEEIERTNRVVKNSKKRTSSASVTAGGGKRAVSEDELTVDQAARLTAEQWNKLSEKTKKRILMGENP
jgi:hypothetical protein